MSPNRPADPAVPPPVRWTAPPRWGLLGYVLCLGLALMAFSPYLPEVLPHGWLSADRWHPPPEAAQHPLPMMYFLVVLPLGALFFRLLRSVRRLRVHGAWLAARAAIVFLLMGSCTASLWVIDGAQAVFDRRFMTSVAGLQPGMSQPAVIAHLLAANADAVGRAAASPSHSGVDTWPKVRFENALFNLDDAYPADPHSQVFRRRYFIALDDDVDYVLNLDYDRNLRLVRLRYLRDHQAEVDPTCDILLERPPVAGRS